MEGNIASIFGHPEEQKIHRAFSCFLRKGREKCFYQERKWRISRFMPLRIRFRQQGRKNQLVYRLVVTDGRSPRDGKYVEEVGYYSPHLEGERNGRVVEEKIRFWLERGAVLSEKAKSFVNRLAPGVLKGMVEKKRGEKKKKNQEEEAQ